MKPLLPTLTCCRLSSQTLSFAHIPQACLYSIAELGGDSQPPANTLRRVRSFAVSYPFGSKHRI